MSINWWLHNVDKKWSICHWTEHESGFFYDRGFGLLSVSIERMKKNKKIWQISFTGLDGSIEHDTKEIFHGSLEEAKDLVEMRVVEIFNEILNKSGVIF